MEWLQTIWFQEVLRTSALLLMLALVIWDLGSFFRAGRHVDCRSLIMGIGLLGTFVGIFIGLSGFDSNDLRGSVPRLLDGLKLAFLTSVLGIAFSVSVHLIQELARALGHRPDGGAPDTGGRGDRLSPRDEALTERLDRLSATLDAWRREAAVDLAPIEQRLDAMLALLRDLREGRRRFTKLAADGSELESSADAFAAVRDGETGLVWEAGAPSEPVSWPDQAEARVEQANADALAGFRDWRLPSAAELLMLAGLSSGPDRRLFAPPADAQDCPWYCSSTADGDACQAVSMESDRIRETGGGRVRLVRSE